MSRNWSFLMTFTRGLAFTSVLLCFAVQISITKKVRKPIESTLTITCSGCDNDGPCLIIINDVMVDKNIYMPLDNGSLILPPNVFGNVTCGDTLEHLTEYLICPPINGVYDWLGIKCSTTMVIKGDVLMCSTTFPFIPHSGISLLVNESVSSDADMTCTSNNIMSQVVNYTCVALNPSRKSIKAQLSFCDIEFNSSTINITIKEQPALNNSSSSITMANGMTPSNMLTLTSDMIMSTTTTISNLAIINSTTTLTAKMTESPAATGTVSNNKNDRGSKAKNDTNVEHDNDLQTGNEDLQSDSGDLGTPNGNVHTHSGDLQTANADVQIASADVQIASENFQTNNTDLQTTNEDERSEVPTTSACVEYLSHEQSSQLVLGTRSITGRKT